MQPGYYIVLRDRILSSAAEKVSYRARLYKGDWLVTDGYWLGRFDKDELDWYPVEWIRNLPVVLNENIEPEIDAITTRIPVTKLMRGFNKLVFTDPSEPTPDMPLPSLSQLRNYLNIHKNWKLAYTYDHRNR